MVESACQVASTERRGRAGAADSRLRRLASAATIAAALTVALASPGAASAATFCVGSPPGCVGTVKSNLQDALDAADANGSNKDTIKLGVSLFTFCPCTDVAGNPVEIVGVAANQTALSTPLATNTNTVLTIDEPTSEISHLRAHMRGGNVMTGFALSGRAEDVLSTNQGGAGITGVKMVGSNAELVDSAVDIIYSAAASNNRAVFVPSGADALIEDSFLSAVAGVAAVGGDAVVRRTEIDADQGVVASGGSNTTVYDSLIDTPGPYSSGLQTAALASAGNGTTTLGAERLTMHASAAGARGVWVTPNNGAGDNASANVQSSVLNGFSTDLYETHSGGATGSITIDWSAYNFASKIGTVTPGTHNLNLSGIDPKFIDPSIGDFQLRYDSPLVDRGNPIFLGPPFDLEGRPRVVNGNGSGSSVVDIGALEYQRAGPTAAALASPATAATGEPVTFDGAGSSDPDPGDVLAFSWSFDDGGTAAGQSVQHAFDTPGQHAATLTVTDPTGLTASATAAVTVSSPAGSGPGTPASALVAPSLTDLRVGPSRFRATSVSAAARKRRRTSAGSTISYQLSENATLTFTVERVLKGRRVKGKCRSPKPGRKIKRRCKRYRKAGSFAAQGLSGANRSAFSGTITGKRLRPARYRLSGQALDGDGLQSAVVRTKFTIARR